MKHLVYIFSILLLMLPISCDKEREHPVPFVHVDFTIAVDDARYYDLNHITGHANFSGGWRGIIIYKASATDFKAYDRSCPFHPYEDKAIISVDEDWLPACPECGSRFELNFGSVIDGPSKHPLREYRTFYNPPYLQVASY